MVIQFRDFGVGVGFPQRHHQLGNGHGTAAQVKEVAVIIQRHWAKLLVPALRQPMQRGINAREGIVPGAGKRPRQGLAVHLAGGFHRHLVHHMQQRHNAAGQALEQNVPDFCHVDGGALLGGQIAHQHRRTRLGFMQRGGANIHVGEVGQVLVDLSQFHAATSEFNLVVGAARENQALLLGAH